MSTEPRELATQFGLSMTQKIMYVGFVVVLILAISLFGGMLTGVYGTVLFVVLAVLLGWVTFFISSGWTFKLEIRGNEIRVTDVRRKPIIIPTDKLGLVVQNNGFPFPSYWLVLKNLEAGIEIPTKGVDAKARELIDAYQKRNPGKKLTIVQLPGGYVRSAKAFATELKRRIPPLTIDERVVK